MLISNFVKTAAYVSLSDIQFATSIALDLLGEETAASKVLTLFLDTTETTESSAHPRNVLEGYLREKYGDGIVLGFISTIYDGEYIELRKDSLYDTKKKVSLKSLLQHTSLENVYNKTMQLLAENPTSKLIYIYTKTSMWFKQFKPRAVPIALQGNTDLIIRLNDAFAEESVKQFCDSGAYESSTCTPQYFLLYAYAHWFKDKKTYIQIVNSRSTLRGTSSEDKRSILDKYVEDSDTYADDNVAYGFDNGLDFRNIASKIYQASSVRLTQIFKIAEKVLEIPDNDYDISFTFNCARVLNSLFLRIQKCVLSLNADVQQGATSYKGNYFLCYAHLYSQKISNLKVPVSRLSNLSPFLDRPFISASYDLSMRNAQLEMEAYKKNYTELLLKVLNTNLLQYEKALIIFKDARLSAQTVLTTVGAPIGLSAAKTEALHALHVKIITTKEKTTSIKLIKMLLNRYGFTVDSNQYLMLNGSYYKVGKYYVHSSGYKVAPGVKEEPDDIVPMINPLSPEDEANIRLSFRVEDD